MFEDPRSGGKTSALDRWGLPRVGGPHSLPACLPLPLPLTWGRRPVGASYGPGGQSVPEQGETRGAGWTGGRDGTQALPCLLLELCSSGPSVPSSLGLSDQCPDPRPFWLDLFIVTAGITDVRCAGHWAQSSAGLSCNLRSNRGGTERLSYWSVVTQQVPGSARTPAGPLTPGPLRGQSGTLARK